MGRVVMSPCLSLLLAAERNFFRVSIRVSLSLKQYKGIKFTRSDNKYLVCQQLLYSLLYNYFENNSPLFKQRKDKSNKILYKHLWRFRIIIAYILCRFYLLKKISLTIEKCYVWQQAANIIHIIIIKTIAHNNQRKEQRNKILYEHL